MIEFFSPTKTGKKKKTEKSKSGSQLTVEDCLLCVYLSRLIGVVWGAAKIRSAGRVDLHLKGWKKKRTCWVFFFNSTNPCCIQACLPPQITTLWIVQALFEITLDLMYCNNSFDHIAEIKHQSCKGLCFQSRGLERDSLMLSDKTGTQQNKHTMKRDWGRSACLMNNKL